MGKERGNEVLVELVMTGADSFYAEEAWRDRIAGVQTCPHCRNVYSTVRSIDAMVRNRRRRTDLDLVSPFCGRVKVLSTHLIDIVGGDLVERVAGLGRVFDVGGFEHDGHRTAVSRGDPVVVRGWERSHPALCRECGRLLYAVAGEGYVLTRDLPAEPFFLSDGRVFCTDRFWRGRIYGARLTRVAAVEWPIRDEPEDGLPAGTAAMKAHLKSCRRFR